ncbi:MAG: hypothetical protein ABI467_23500 [Kofleriaceae bacterium]
MKRLPHALVLGLGLEIAFSVAYLIVMVTSREAMFGATWPAVANGIDVASHVLIGAGALYFARAAAGRAATGAKLVAAGQLGMLVMLGCWLAIAQWHPAGYDRVLAWIAYLRYAQSIVVLATAVGFALIARPSAVSLALPIVAIAGVPLPVVGRWLYAGVDSVMFAYVIQMLPFIVLAGLSIVAVWSRRDELAEPPRPGAGQAFTAASNALWLRVIAAVSLAAFGFLVGFTRTDEAARLLRAVMLLAPLCDAIALVLFARALLALARTAIAPWWLTASAAFALAAVGMIATRVTSLYALFYGDRGSGSTADDPSVITNGLVAQLVPLVAAIGIALVLIAVARLARERADDDVRENVVIRTGVFVALIVGAMLMAHFTTNWLSEGAGAAAIALLSIAGATLYALTIAAKLCAQGAELVARDPVTLPAAKLVRS